MSPLFKSSARTPFIPLIHFSLMPLASFSYPKKGLPPGSLVYVGERPGQSTVVERIPLAPRQRAERLDSEGAIRAALKKPGLKWFSVTGLSDAQALGRIGRLFGLHPLQIEDVMNTRSRPKLDTSPRSEFIVLKALSLASGQERVHREHVAVAFSKDWVISFQERQPDDFEPVRLMLQRHPHPHALTPDFLAYLLLDSVVDRYFGVLEQIGERINRLDGELSGRPTPSTLRRIQLLKAELMRLRRHIWPVREMVGRLRPSEHRLVRPSTEPYLRDTQDHVIEMLDLIEMYRDMLSTMVDVYLSTLSNRINEIMKVLAVISTVFMPLAFLTGLYGMNFRHIPLADWDGGFYAIAALSAAVAGGLLLYFKRRGWF